MENIAYEDLAESLIESVPELRPAYEAERDWWGEETPGPHVVYGDVLNPYIVTLLESGPHAEERLRRVFEFLERLARHEDIHVQEVVQMTVCEGLLANEEWQTRARDYMGEATLRLCQEIEDFWRRAGSADR